MSLRYLLTWVPAFAFPLSHLVQIYKMLKTGEVQDVAVLTFYGYFLGNMGAYLFVEKYFDIRTLMAFVLTAFLEIVIVSIWAYKKGDKKVMGSAIISGMSIASIVFYLILTEHRLLKTISSFAGYFPSLFFPLATMIQLVKIAMSGTLYGVSCKGWILQIVANIGAYLLTGKLRDLKSITAFLLTAIIDVAIVIVYMIYSKSIWKCFL